MIQVGWWLVLMRGSPSLLDELGTFWISDHRGSWIRMMSKSFWVLSRVWTISEFFQTFCNRILRDFKFIVDLRCSLLNRWILTCSHRSQNISSSTTPCWNNVTRRSMHLSQLDDHHSSYSIWMCRGRICLSLFLISESWSCHSLCSTIQILCGFPTCGGCYTWYIWSPVFCTKKWCDPISSSSCTGGLLGSCLLSG